MKSSLTSRWLIMSSVVALFAAQARGAASFEEFARPEAPLAQFAAGFLEPPPTLPGGLVFLPGGDFLARGYVADGNYPYLVLFRVDRAGRHSVFFQFPLRSGTAGQPGYTALGQIVDLVLASDGNLYGLRELDLDLDVVQQRALNQGTFFRLTLGGVYTELHTFPATGIDGSGSPEGYGGTHLIEGADGHFYGTTQFRSMGSGMGVMGGTFFRMTKAGGYTRLNEFATSTESITLLREEAGGDFLGLRHGQLYVSPGSIVRVAKSGAVSLVTPLVTSRPWVVPWSTVQGSAALQGWGTTTAGEVFVSVFGSDQNLPPREVMLRMAPDGSLTELETTTAPGNTQGLLAVSEAPNGKLYGTGLSVGGPFGAPRLFEQPRAAAIRVLGSSEEDGLGNRRGDLVIGPDGFGYQLADTTDTGSNPGWTGAVFRVPLGYDNALLALPGAVGYWPFDEERGLNSFRGSYTGAATGGATLPGGGNGPAIQGLASNSALALDGTGRVATTLTGVIGANGSLAAWVRLSALPSERGRAFFLAGQGAEFSLEIGVDDRVRFSAGAGAALAAPGRMRKGEWHFIAGTTAGAARQLFIDGALVAADAGGAHTVGSVQFTMGDLPGAPSKAVEGALDEVAIFDRALTAAEVATLWSLREAGRGTVQQPFSIAANANIHSAGHAALVAPGGGGAGTRPALFKVPAGTGTLAITASGALTADGGTTQNDADGTGSAGAVNVSAAEGLSAFGAARAGALVGVFTGFAEPADPAPPALFTTSSPLDFAEAAPALGQVFFIGDGLAGAGAAQVFRVPSGAQRLFLGFADAPGANGAPGGFADNLGFVQAQVQVFESIDLQVSFENNGTPNPVQRGEAVAYTIYVDNIGPNAALTPKLTVALPAGATVQSCNFPFTPVTLVGGGAGIEIEVPTVQASAGRETVALTLVAPATGTSMMVVATAYATSPTQIERDASDNTASATTTIAVPPPRIEGTITDAASAPLAGVVVTLAGDAGASTATNGAGRFAFTNVATGGNYTVTPGKLGFAFTPQSATVSALSGTRTVNFSGAENEVFPDLRKPKKLKPGSFLSIGGGVTVFAESFTLIAAPPANALAEVPGYNGRGDAEQALVPPTFEVTDSGIYAASGKVDIGGVLTLEGPDIRVRLDKEQFVFEFEAHNAHLHIDGIPRIGRVTLGKARDIAFRLTKDKVFSDFLTNQVQSALRIAGLNVTLLAGKILTEAPGQGVEIQGELKIDSIPGLPGLKVAFSNLSIRRDTGVQFASELKLPDLALGGFGLKDATISYFPAVDPTRDIFQGQGTLEIPYLLSLGADVRLVGGLLDRIGVDVSLAVGGIPLFPPPGIVPALPPILIMSGGEILVDGLVDKPFRLLFAVDLTLADANLAKVLALTRCGIEYTAPDDIKGIGDLSVLQQEIAGVYFGLKLPTELYFGGHIELIESFPVIVGDWRFAGGMRFVGGAAKSFLEGDAKVTARIPDGTGFPYDLLKVIPGVSLPIEVANAEAHLRLPSEGFPITTSFTVPVLDKVQVALKQEAQSIAVKIASNIPFLPNDITIGAAPRVGALAASQQLVGRFTTVAGTEKFIVSVTGAAAAPAFTLIAPDGTRITTANAGANATTFLTNDAVKKTFAIVDAPPAGVWQAEVDGVSVTACEGYGANAAPVLGPVTVAPQGGSDFAITYSASDPDSDAKVSLYFDNDASGFSGQLLALDLAETASGTFAWSPESVPAGEYSIYALADDGVNEPVRAYAPGRVTVADPLAPATPTGVTAQPGGENTLLISWDANTESDLRGYQIRYAVDQGAGTTLTESFDAGASTTARLTRLTDNATYRIVVVAYSAASDEASGATTSHASPPSASVTATTGTASAPVVTITGPTGPLEANRPTLIEWTIANGSDVERQHLEISHNGGTDWQPLVAGLSASQRSFLFETPTGLTGATALRFRVSAADLFGNRGTGSSAANIAVIAEDQTPRADLVGSFVNPAVAAGPKLTGKFAVTNLGAKLAKKPQMRFVLSSDALFDAADTKLGKFKPAKLGPNKTATFPLPKLKLSRNTSLTGKFILAVSDDGKKIDENDETNNVAIFGPLP